MENRNKFHHLHNDQNGAINPAFDNESHSNITNEGDKLGQTENFHRKIHISQNHMDKIEEEDEGKDEEEEEDYGFSSWFESYFKENSRITKTIKWVKMNDDVGKIAKNILPVTVLLLYIAFLFAVIVIQTDIQEEAYWCSGDGFLYIWTLIIATGLIYSKILKEYFSEEISKCFQPLTNLISKFWEKSLFRKITYLLLVAAVVAFYIVDTAGQRRRLVSFIGLFFIITCGFLASYAPRKIVWRYTIWGMSIQFILALCVLRWPLGSKVLACLADKVSQFLAYSLEGAIFVFGELLAGENSTIFAFTVLPVTIFFSFFTNILYYYGVVQWMVIKVGWLFQITVGTSLCESMNAAGSIFLGMTESPLLVKPYLSLMTNSELHAIMTAGFATIAGSVMAAYISLGADTSLLLTASVMNAPAALALSKLFYPNTQKTRITATTIRAVKSSEANALHAGCVGVTNALPLVANIAANLIAFISFVAFLNAIFDWGCQLVDFKEGACTLENAFGYIFMPLAWMMGVQWSDCNYVGQLIGLKIILNEFVAYTKLKEFVDAGLLSPRSEAIATFALCGFGNISSVGIMLGGLGPLAPERRDDLAKLAFRAMVAGAMATFSSACIAGTLLSYTDELPELTAIMVNTTQAAV